MRPASGVSRPATQRSVVVLPQPEGPSRLTNSPSAATKLTSSMTSLSPKRLLSPSTLMLMPFPFQAARNTWRDTSAMTATMMRVETTDSALALPQLAFSKKVQIEIEISAVLEV